MWLNCLCVVVVVVVVVFCVCVLFFVFNSPPSQQKILYESLGTYETLKGIMETVLLNKALYYVCGGVH